MFQFSVSICFLIDKYIIKIMSDRYVIETFSLIDKLQQINNADYQRGPKMPPIFVFFPAPQKC